ncbi:MAG: flagellar hook-length control protein FliK [Rhodocyclaceae bacterium]|nr:flagellar hook-length control protein FliK [Rhodocyclaceae bacterium]
MGISVLPTATLNAPGGKDAGSQLPANGGGGTDFASLLSLQLASPQLSGLQLQIAGDAGIGAALKDLPADSERTAAGLDAGALLAAAGLLPAFMAAAKPAQEATDASLLAGQGSEPGAMTGLLGRPDGKDNEGSLMGMLNGTAKGDLATFLTGKLAGGDSANIAADLQPASGGGQNFAATLAAQTGLAQGLHAPGDSPAATVATPIGNSRWGQDFGQQVVWLAKNDQQVAQLNINPPQLGPMHITLNLSGDQASAMFVSPHAEVRQAIQDAMPQLREMLAGAGINLGQANVGAHLPQQNGGAQPQFSAPSRLADDNAILRADNGQGTAVPLPAVRGGRGMVDLFA